jgi:hypothetical protein
VASVYADAFAGVMGYARRQVVFWHQEARGDERSGSVVD